MGVWGMGLTQSDEFMANYDRFVDEYNAGEEPDLIGNRIIKEYEAEFGETDGVLHDVYFAVAKAQWERGALQPAILNMVRQLIEKKANLKLYEELGASVSDLKKREEVLEAFLEKISTPIANSRGRIKKREQRPFPYSKGCVFAYDYANGYGGGVVLDIITFDGAPDLALIAIADICCSTLASRDDILNAMPFTLSWFTKREMLPKKMISMLGNVEILKSFNHFAGVSISKERYHASNFGNRTAFFKDESFRLRFEQYRIPLTRIKDYIAT